MNFESIVAVSDNVLDELEEELPLCTVHFDIVSTSPAIEISHFWSRRFEAGQPV